ncbi:YheC/YheD family protein [Rossellomorea aquimaris]|uniref:YheC/YheD family protein n=1 Tax=Rossellomorea aquimaris TaxID=189382 RepID=UPI0005CB4552|nr:YheC/YheD family protein [Rossellomorea aquimaris]
MKVSTGKYTKYTIMKKDPALAPYLPVTEMLTFQSFSDLLEKFGAVIVKPTAGLRGIGVIQIRSIEGHIFEIHSKSTKTEVVGKVQAFNYLNENHLSRKKKYIVQQRIPLALIKECVFDTRVMVQRKRNSSEWKVTGVLVKVAAKGFVATNYARGVMNLEEAIEQSTLTNKDTNKVLSELKEVALGTAIALQDPYPTRRRIGLDIGITDDGQIYIIEANLTPTISMFNLLKDKSMLEEIRKYRRG